VSGKAEIITLAAPVADAALGQLADVLVDCVEGGASVSFMSPLTHAEALAFFRKVAGLVAAGDTVLLAARLAAGSSARCSSGWTRRRTSRIAPTSRKCWCTARRAAAASARR
jgi:hypothetical protein